MPQLEKSPHSNKNPAQQKINKIFLKIRERRDLNRDIKEKAMKDRGRDGNDTTTS